MTVNDVLQFLKSKGIDYKLVGDAETEFHTFCPLKGLKNGAITWARKSKNVDVEKLNGLDAIVLVAEKGGEIHGARFPVIYVENAHRTYFRVVGQIFSGCDVEHKGPGVAPTAIVETNDIGEGVFIGHHTYIGPDVSIGKHVTILHNVTIQGRVRVGDHTVIESGTTVGACGFGHYDDEAGNPVCVPHFGGVVIGAHVKIGANNAISRGCLADTVIGDYVKTDNQCHIAHNDHIKNRAMLTANTVISGSVTVGEGAWLAPGSLLNDSIEVGDNAFFGIGAVATKDVPRGKVVVGMPAKVLRDR